jgi:hypothetical protein
LERKLCQIEWFHMTCEIYIRRAIKENLICPNRSILWGITNPKNCKTPQHCDLKLGSWSISICHNYGFGLTRASSVQRHVEKNLKHGGDETLTQMIMWMFGNQNEKKLRLSSCILPLGIAIQCSFKSSWVNVWWGQLCSNRIHSLINHKHFEKGYDKLGLHFQKLVCLENYVHLEKKMMLNWGA